MALAIVFRPQAEDELLEVRQWYEARRAGSGREFGEAADSLINRIAANPLAFPRVHNDTRGGLCSRAFRMQSIFESLRARLSC